MNYDLQRFHKAQIFDYPVALGEIKNGRKESHWMWYIFPQLKELGYSSTAKYYGLTKDEAKAYLKDEILKSRLIEISQVLLELKSNDATEIFGYPDDLKLKSSMTLFSEIAPEIEVFNKVLEKFFSGKKDDKTLELLEK
ncbi:MAG: DUF1810 domain-containing protein [Treponemataceae bacterium]|jgi:uncharacterized protein (DUF1810 family)|nr:DUF1810 domain-containing protein [Treponemataceae bacterium]